MATINYPEANLQTQTTLKNFKEKSIDVAYRFGQNLSGFAQVIGISRVQPVQSGFKIQMYGKPEVTLADGSVAEGELIPLSHVTPVAVVEKLIELKKYRKATSGEAIQRYGFSNAIDVTDDAMVKEIQRDVRTDLFAAVQAGEAKSNLKAGSLQGALATAWAAIQTVFEDDAVQTVVFAHPEDIAKANAEKAVTLENQFGLNYYTDVTGTIVFATSQVAKGTIYATAPENLILAYIPASNSELGQAFDLASDDTGFIGVAHFVEHQSLTHQTVATSGVLIYPERLDGVVKVEIGTAGV